jgi:hypothetical protein
MADGKPAETWAPIGSCAARWQMTETPLAMLAYLQRLDVLSFDVNAAGFGAKDDLSLYEHSGHSANVSLAGQFYLRDVILGGGLHYARNYDFQHPSAASGSIDQRHTTQLAYPELSLGVRSETFECVGIYRFKTYFDDGTARAPTWGQASFGVRDFVEPQAYWNAFLYTVVHGAGLSFDFEFFASPRLGIWFDGYLEHGAVYVNSPNDYSRRSFEVGAGWWASSRFELQFSVRVSTAQYDAMDATTLTTGLGTFGIVVRAPTHYHVQSSPLADPVVTSAPPSVGVEEVTPGGGPGLAIPAAAEAPLP